MLAGTLPLELAQETIRELASQVASEVREELRLAPPQPAATLDDLLTFQQLLEKGSGRFTKGQLRGWLMHRETNGLGKAVSKVGGRLYFDERLFVAWLFGRTR